MRFFDWEKDTNDKMIEIRTMPYDKNLRAHLDVAKCNVFVR
jgi:hypothetical protein